MRDVVYISLRRFRAVAIVTIAISVFLLIYLALSYSVDAEKVGDGLINVSHTEVNGSNVSVWFTIAGDYPELASEPVLRVGNARVTGTLERDGDGLWLTQFRGVPHGWTEAELEVPAIASEMRGNVMSDPFGEILQGPGSYRYQVVGWMIDDNAGVAELEYRPLDPTSPAIKRATLRSRQGEEIHATSLTSVYSTTDWTLDYGIIAFPADSWSTILTEGATLALTAFQRMDADVIVVRWDE